MAAEAIPAHLTPGARSPFTGRAGEMETILRVASDAAGGRSAALVVTGEPGAGKSRLAAEACGRITAVDGARTFHGFALDHAEGSPPLHPPQRALRSLARDRVADLPKPVAAVLAAAGLAPAGAVGRVGRLEQPAERVRIAEALADLVTAVAQERLIVVALDDMQGAAPALWEVLVHLVLVRMLDGHPLMFLLTARDEVLTGMPHATQALSEWSRLRVLTHLPLAVLGRGEVSVLTARILGGEVSDDLIDSLARRTGGNPFFLEEVLEHLLGTACIERRDDRWTLGEGADIGQSPTLRLVIADRLRPLPDPVHRTLDDASVLGRAFSVRVLARMLGEPAGAVVASLGVAAIAGLVERGTEDQWRFRHDTVREAVYDGTRDHRADLHRACPPWRRSAPWRSTGCLQVSTCAPAVAGLRRTGETLRWSRLARGATDAVGTRIEVAEARADHALRHHGMR